MLRLASLALVAALLLAGTAALHAPPPVTDAHKRVCAAFAPYEYTTIADIHLGPPAIVAVVTREVMGGFLSYDPLPPAEAARRLGWTDAAMDALLRDLEQTGASAVMRWQLMGDDLGYHGGLGILLREETALMHPTGWRVCASATSDVPPTALRVEKGCRPEPAGQEAWWWCPLAAPAAVVPSPP